MRRWATYVAGAAVGAAVLAGGTAGAGDSKPTDRRTEQITFYGQPDPAGDAFLPADPTAEPPTGEESDVPKVGDEIIFTDTLYALGGTPAAPAPAGDAVGVVNVRCLASQVFEAEQDAALTCSGVMSIEDRGDLTIQGRLRFSEFDDPGFIEIAITGGTGEFYDGGGEIVVRDVPGDDSADEEGSTPSTYELQVLHLAEAGRHS
jgi:hypothetical protein